MTVNIKYVYSNTGKIEAAIVPIELWTQLAPKEDPPSLSFDPVPFRGMLRSYSFDIEKELKKMRDEWTSNI